MLTVDATVNRSEQIVGDEWRPHVTERQATKAEVTVHALNRILELGRRATSVSSEPKCGQGWCACIR